MVSVGRVPWLFSTHIKIDVTHIIYHTHINYITIYIHTQIHTLLQYIYISIYIYTYTHAHNTDILLLLYIYIFAICVYSACYGGIMPCHAHESAMSDLTPRQTALHFAAREGRDAAVAELIRRHADVSRRSAHGILPLELAAGHPNTQQLGLRSFGLRNPCF